MKNKRQIIELKTDGTWSNTKISVNGNEIQAKTITIQGNNESDLDVILGLSLSKATVEQIKESATPIGFTGQDIVGYVDNTMEENYLDDEEE